MSIITPAVRLELTEKKLKLDTIRAALKTEFFGIDQCIDAVMEAIQTWYLFPSIITRCPVIFLVGQTGVGKTALVRSLVAHLGMTKSFLEIQMDGFSSSNTSEIKTISGLIHESGIEENKQGIILLDEFQRFRTIDDHGEDIKLERYPDVWMLLSDGRFPVDHSKMQRLIEYMNVQEYWEDREAQQRAENEAEAEARGDKPKARRPAVEVKRKTRFFMTHDEAEDMRQILRCPDTVKEIMGWPKDKTRETIEKYLASNSTPPFDYTKCLVFVSGNLDEAFRMSGNVEDCDTSADVFYQHTLKIGVPEIKSALATRFRPEQIARLGNNHIIYPSLRESAYMSIIRRGCLQYIEQASKICDIVFTIDDSVYQEIYDNSVYPTQGTRPVFTSIHKLFGSPLSDAILWGLEHDFPTIAIALDIATSSLLFKHGAKEKRVKVDFEIRARRKNRSADFNALVAVHEAGHALVYAILFCRAPVEVSANVASFKGGYNLFEDIFLCQSEVLHRIAVGMAGIAAEEAVFGTQLRSTGCESDINSATRLAAQYVRRWAMDKFQSLIVSNPDALSYDEVKRSDDRVDTIVSEQKDQARTLIGQHRPLLLELSNQLLQTPKMDGAAFVTFLNGRIPHLTAADDRDVSGDYAARLQEAS